MHTNMKQHFFDMHGAFTNLKLTKHIILIAFLLSIATLLSIEIANYMQLLYIYWAGYACIRVLTSDRSLTLHRGIMRCISTIIALSFVILIAYYVHNVWLILALMTVFTFFSILLAYHYNEYTYFFIMFAITLALFIYPSLTISNAAALKVIVNRASSTLIGTICIFIFAIPFLKKKEKLQKPSLKDRAEKITDSIVFSIFFMIAIIFIFIITLPMKNILLFEQALIGLIAVMSAFEHYNIRHLSVQRFVGTAFGLGAALLISAFHLNMMLIFILSFFIIAVFAIIQLQPKEISYFGAQGNLCYISAAFTGNSVITLQTGYERFISTFITLAGICFVAISFGIYQKLKQ